MTESAIPIMRNTFILIFAAASMVGCAHSSTPAPAPVSTQPIAAQPEKSDSEGNPLTSVKEGFESFGTSITRSFNNLWGKAPSTYAKLMESDAPDARREGIAGLIEEDFGRRPPYTTRYMQIAQSDPDPLVRAMALRALSRSREKSAGDLFVKALSDSDRQIRLEGAKGLSNISDPNAISGLLRLLASPEEEKDIRIAAADALQHYKKLEVARVLVQMLSDRDFGIAFQSRRSLKVLTGRDLRYNESAWLQYLTGPEKPFG